jgi:hypothetical protein
MMYAVWDFFELSKYGSSYLYPNYKILNYYPFEFYLPLYYLLK